MMKLTNDNDIQIKTIMIKLTSDTDVKTRLTMTFK